MDVAKAAPVSGFCLKQYAQVGEARNLALAPNGDLFVAGPSNPTAGGATGGKGSIFVLSDDDHDGVAESHVFLSSVADVHGIALGGGYLYYTTRSTVFRTPYMPGQRVASGPSEDLKLPAIYGTGGRWTHGLARSAGGQLVTTRGAYAQCATSNGGDISSINADGTLTVIAKGFRNPMYVRCHRTDEVCAAMELGEDLTMGATEKMLMLHPNTDYGFPCCLKQNAPIPDMTNAMCGAVTKEDADFPLSDTPFGFDWEPGTWPAPFQNAVFVALHGSAYASDDSSEWKGTAIVYAAADPTTHMPVQDWQTFQGGFGGRASVLSRATDVLFSNDGRMFIADDTSGRVYWMAPTTQMAPTP
jgi:glucose/arabinose dehydrogenase